MYSAHTISLFFFRVLGGGPLAGEGETAAERAADAVAVHGEAAPLPRCEGRLRRAGLRHAGGGGGLPRWAGHVAGGRTGLRKAPRSGWGGGCPALVIVQLGAFPNSFWHVAPESVSPAWGLPK